MNSEQHREEYYTDGLTILRNVIPPSLMADLRVETDKAREIARKQSGPQAQRMQSIRDHEELNHSLFREFQDLPVMRAVVEGVLGNDRTTSESMTVLFEPANTPWCTAWHRDWAGNIPHVDLDAYFKTIRNTRMFNQLNAALYEDQSLWVVPGSHNRDDTEYEAANFTDKLKPAPGFTNDMADTERETTATAYARSMPGALQVGLSAGDVAFYRSSSWHIGNYVPYTKRATLHCGYYCDADLEWSAAVREWQKAAGAPISVAAAE